MVILKIGYSNILVSCAKAKQMLDVLDGAIYLNNEYISGEGTSYSLAPVKEDIVEFSQAPDDLLEFIKEAEVMGTDVRSYMNSLYKKDKA